MRLKAALLTGAGCALLGMGAVGIVLPLWPTTPFVLAAAGCFAYAPNMQARVMKIPFFRDHIVNYRDRKGLSRDIVVKSLAFLWGMLALSGILARRLWLVPILLAVGVCVTAHILHMARPRAGGRK